MTLYRTINAVDKQPILAPGELVKFALSDVELHLDGDQLGLGFLFLTTNHIYFIPDDSLADDTIHTRGIVIPFHQIVLNGVQAEGFILQLETQNAEIHDCLFIMKQPQAQAMFEELQPLLARDASRDSSDDDAVFE
ncbi:hypothetical protein GEMRC1_008864 [Eukaryota sp. GEM-RC1]